MASSSTRTLDFYKWLLSGSARALNGVWRYCRTWIAPQVAIRKVEAALAVTRQLRRQLEQTAQPLLLLNKQLLARELEDLLAFLTNEGLWNDRPVRFGPNVADKTSTRIIQDWTEHPALENGPVRLLLDGMERRLLMHLWQLGARPKSFADELAVTGGVGAEGRGQSDTAGNIASSGDDGATQPGPSTPAAAKTIAPSEAALLGTLTEKFYGSWAFRIAAGILVVAATFAVAGGAVIGNQTYNVRQEIQQNGDRALKDIADRLAATTTVLDERRNAADAELKELAQRTKEARQEIESQKEALATQRRDFAAALDAGKLAVAQAVADQKSAWESERATLKEDLLRLRDEAVKKVVADLTANVGNVQEGIKNQVVADLGKIRDEDVRQLRELLNELRPKVDALKTQLETQSREAAALGPQLSRLSAMAQQSDDLERAARDTKEHEAAARKAAGDAKLSATSAAAHEGHIEKSKDALWAVLASIGSATREIVETAGKQRGQLEAIGRDLNSLASSVQNLRSELAELEKVPPELRRAQATTSQLNEQLAGLMAQANAVDRRAKAAASIFDQAEPTLPRLIKAEGSTGRIEERLAELQPRVEETKGRVDKIAPAISAWTAVASEVSKIETSVIASHGRLERLQIELADLTRRIDEERHTFGQLPSRPPSASKGPTNPDWQILQSGLFALGFGPGKIDGVDGPKTRDAIRRFQKGRGEPVTGELTPPQIEILRNAAARQQTSSLVQQ